MVLVFGMTFVGCDDGTTNGNGKLDTAVIAKWYTKASDADTGASPLFEITSFGTIIGTGITGAADINVREPLKTLYKTIKI